MHSAVVVFTVVCWLIFAVLVGAYGRASIRKRKVQPGLWLALGIVSVSWMEAPYDNAMFAVYHPDFARLPKWGPIGATQGGLPVIAAPGYVWYFMLPALGGVLLARWGIRHRGWRPTSAYLTCGLVVGMAFDFVIEVSQARWLHLWTYARITPGLAVSSGTRAQFPVHTSLAMGLFVAGATYALGKRTLAGNAVLDEWVADRFARTTPSVRTALAYVAAANVLYFLTMVPYGLARLGHTLTVVGAVQPYATISPQPAGHQSNGPIGTAIIVMWLLGMTVGGLVLARRADRRESVTTSRFSVERVATTAEAGVA